MIYNFNGFFYLEQYRLFAFLYHQVWVEASGNVQKTVSNRKFVKNMRDNIKNTFYGLNI